MRRAACLFLCLLLLLGAVGCGPQERLCRVMIEKGEHFTASPWECEVKAGEDARFALSFEEGYYFRAADADAVYEDGVLTVRNVRASRMVVITVGRLDPDHGTFVSEPAEGGLLYSALPEEGYYFTGWYGRESGELLSREDHTVLPADLPVMAHFEAAGEAQIVTYHAGDGSLLHSPDKEIHCAFFPDVYLYPASLGSELFELFFREGYAPLEYNTAEDLSGEAISPGSRILSDERHVDLWIVWEKESTEFSYEQTEGGVTLTKYTGGEEFAVVPAELGGLPVIGIGSGCFTGPALKGAMIGRNVKRVAQGAFSSCPALKTLYLCDGVTEIGDASFTDCPALSDLRMIAVMPPVYTDDLIGSAVRRVERLFAARNGGPPNMLFYGGSGMYQSIDGACLAEAFPEYAVMELGQNVNISGPFMLEFFAEYLKEGDVLVYAPEALSTIYSVQWNMTDWIALEAYYDALRQIDIRDYFAVFDSFEQFQLGSASFSYPGRVRMSPHSYTDFCGGFDEYFTRDFVAEYDEDIHLRPRNESLDDLLREIPAVEKVYEEDYLPAGVRMYFSYPAMYENAYSRTYEEFVRFYGQIAEQISFPFISDYDSHLYGREYIYDEVGHLTTEGAQINSLRLAAALKAQFALEASRSS